MVGHPHREELVGAEAQGVADGRVGLPAGEMVDDGVVRPQAAECAADQLGGEGGVTPLDPALPQELRQDQVGVGVVLRTATSTSYAASRAASTEARRGAFPAPPESSEELADQLLRRDCKPCVGDHLGQLLARSSPSRDSCTSTALNP